MIRVKQATKQGYIEVDVGGCFNYSFPNSKLRRGRVQGDKESICPTLDTNCHVGVVMPEKPICNNIEDISIRRLTPRECFRLQGFPDEYFERAAKVCSDSQLYKQAGNSVTVNVIYEIARRLR